MRIAELCAGYGGLGMALDLAGLETDLAWYAEIDPAASAVMAHHHPDTVNVGDLRQYAPNAPGHVQYGLFAPETLEPVDLIAAGFPCQDISLAGLQKGLGHETRSGLWWAIHRIVSDLRPRFVLLENVAAIRRNGGPEVIGSLTAIGYDSRWVSVRASDVGAPHQRARWFCLATDSDGDRLQGQSGGGPELGEPPRRNRNFVADPGGLGRIKGPGPSASEPAELGRDGPHNDRGATATDSDGATVGDEPDTVTRRSNPAVARPDRETTWGEWAGAVHRWEQLTRPAPAPTINGNLNPRFTEWMMGLPDGYVTGPVTDRAAALRVLGNGVVPQQAAAALAAL